MNNYNITAVQEKIIIDSVKFGCLKQDCKNCKFYNKEKAEQYSANVACEYLFPESIYDIDSEDFFAKEIMDRVNPSVVKDYDNIREAIKNATFDDQKFADLIIKCRLAAANVYRKRFNISD